MANQAVGVDGCKAGWIAVTSDEGDTLRYELFGTMREIVLAHREAERFLVDIPIGLPWREHPTRPCDELARHVLKHRHVCVFASPSRAACHANTKVEARQRNLEELGKSLSEQALGICAKVAEVDTLLRQDDSARDRIREVHPEVCFWAMNGGRPMNDAKTSPAGIASRLAILKRRLPSSDALLMRVLDKRSRAEVRADDVLDALAAYVTAAADPAVLLRLQGEPSHDLEQLPMEMLYIQ